MASAFASLVADLEAECREDAPPPAGTAPLDQASWTGAVSFAPGSAAPHVPPIVPPVPVPAAAAPAHAPNPYPTRPPSFLFGEEDGGGDPIMGHRPPSADVFGRRRSSMESMESAPSLGHRPRGGGLFRRNLPEEKADEKVQLKSPWPVPAPTVPAKMPSTLPLREWVQYQANVAQRTTVPRSNKCSWREGNAGKNRGEEKYLERAVAVALSLARKLEHPSVGAMIHERDVVLENVVVLNTADGESDFVQTTGTETNRTTGDDGPSRRSRRREIAALGRVYYALFAKGTAPPSQARTGCSGSTAATTCSSFGAALRLGNGGGTEAMEEDAEDPAFEHRARRRRKDDERSVRDMLHAQGLPSSICRLVADMMDNDDSENVFARDAAVASFADVVADLEQMRDRPREFLHDSMRMRFKPEIGKKLYCREKEMGRALEVAGRCDHREQGREELEFGMEEAALMGPRKREVLMVSGHSGSGKTLFANELGAILQKRGWRRLHCKFDRVHPQPLSFITSAFDRYFAQLVAAAEAGDVDGLGEACDFNGQGETDQIRTAIRKSFCEENLGILCHLIPTLRRLLAEDGVPREAPQRRESSFDTTDAVASKCRLHHLVGLLVGAISQTRPVLLVLDDIHWADEASLDLLAALMGGVGEEIREEDEEEGALPLASSDGDGPGVLFMGTFRTHELAASAPLTARLDRVKTLSNVTYTPISLSGLSPEDVNVMVSEALCYPKRLSRSLSNLIHEKSAGNPLFVKELLNDLAVENLLNYSLSSRNWEWDEEVIEARTISDGVAELLTRKLLRLPASALSALRVLSMFGSESSIEVLTLVRDTCGNSDIIAELDRPMSEGLIKKTTESCTFVHDMIQQTVYSCIKPAEMSTMLKEISETLLVRTGDGRTDAVLFIIVDLINRLGPQGASAMDSMRYASLNLSAGEKGIQTPDFASARTYLEAGISFLGPDCWCNNYNLSLHLFKNAALVQYAQGNTTLMTKRMNEVIENARSFEDKVDSLSLAIHASTMGAFGLAKAFDKSFSVLEQLGETFPVEPDNETIARELMAAKARLEQYQPSTISGVQPMSNPLKVKAMEIFPALLAQCYQQKSRYYSLVGCRMTMMSLQHGLHENSALGFCGLALAYATVFQDVSEGYKLGKYALALTTNKNTPSVFLTMLGMISIWKEPVQAILPDLLRAHNMGLKYGSITESLISSMLYSWRAFLCGSNLSSLDKDTALFMRQYVLYQRHLLCLSMKPLLNAVMRLSGRSPQQKAGNMGLMDEDQIFAKSLEAKELVVCEAIVVCKMMCSFIFRQLDKAEEVTRKYAEFFERHDGAGSLQFINIYRFFYSGLIAFDCYRRTQDEYWNEIGARAISKFEYWTKECSEWNFSNKLRLLIAEQQFANGSISEATQSYNLAISLSRDYRFVHEEALSSELAGIFYRHTGQNEKSIHLLKQAHERYETWGAQAKANSLVGFLQ